MPGACAPSTSVSIPRSVERGDDLAHTGSTRAVGLVTWSTMTSRVRGADGSQDGVARRLGRRRPGMGRDAVTTGRRRHRPPPGSRCVQRGRRGRAATISSPASRRSDARDDVDARGRVRDEGEVVRIGAEERAQSSARASSSAGSRSSGEERDRLPLHPLAPGVLRLEDGARRRAERPVVQEGDRRIERPVDGELGGHRARYRTTDARRSRLPTRSCSTSTARWSTRSPARIDAWTAAFAEVGIPVDPRRSWSR